MTFTKCLIPQSDILIVDDTINNVRLLSEMLTDSGFSVRKAISGSMALMAVRASLPDLILLDINMSDMNGYEVCEQLKNDPQTQNIPVIFLSALNAAFDKVRAFSLGGSDYITKPFQNEEVIARIQHHLTLGQLKVELEAKNEELEQALIQLKSVQAELIQKQKMLGLNQLVAGIAHEINNPISFIAGNLKPAQKYFSDLLDIVNLYQQHYPHPAEEIKAAIAAAELDFIRTDCPHLLQSMETGTNRIRDLIQALHTFSLLGETGLKSINLQDTLESILILLQPRLRELDQRPAITVHRQYSPLPAITCDAKMLNQALMNLFNNALDAIDQLWAQMPAAIANGHVEAAPPTLTITTTVRDRQWLVITIRDTGIGITDAIKARIYEPFFTTKPVGQGSGLGLSMSYQTIVSQHQGHLFFTSTPGQGSEFVVELPIAAADED